MSVNSIEPLIRSAKTEDEMWVKNAETLNCANISIVNAECQLGRGLIIISDNIFIFLRGL